MDIDPCIAGIVEADDSSIPAFTASRIGLIPSMPTTETAPTLPALLTAAAFSSVLIVRTWRLRHTPLGSAFLGLVVCPLTLASATVLLYMSRPDVRRTFEPDEPGSRPDGAGPAELQRRRHEFHFRQRATGGRIDAEQAVGGTQLRHGCIGALAFGVGARLALEAQQVVQRRLEVDADAAGRHRDVELGRAVLVGLARQRRAGRCEGDEADDEVTANQGVPQAGQA